MKLYLQKFTNHKNLFKLIGIVIFFLIIIFEINLKEFYYTILQIETDYLVTIFIVLMLSSLIPPLRWKYILKKMDVKVSFFGSYYINYISMLMGTFTPAKIGEIGAKVSFFLKHKPLIIKSIASIVVEKLLDIGSLVIFASLSTLFYIKLLPSQFQITAVTFLCFCGAITLLIIKDKLDTLIGKVISLIIPKKYNLNHHFEMLYKNFTVIGAKGYFFTSCLTMLNWFLGFLITYFFALSVGVDIPFIYFAMSSAIASLTSLIPISISGLGVKEGTYLVLLVPFSISTEKIIIFSVTTTLFFNFFLLLIGSICYLINLKNINKKIVFIDTLSSAD